MKKFLSILIAVLVIVSALPMIAVSASDVVTYDVVCSQEDLVNLSFTPEKDGYYVFYTACDEDTTMCLYGYDYMLWAEDTSAEDSNFRLKAKLEKGETYRLEVSTWSSDPCAVTVYVEPAETYVVSGKMVKTPDIDYTIEGAEYESLWLEGMEIEFTLSDGTKETYTYDYDMTLAMMHVDGGSVYYVQDALSDTVRIICDDAVVEWKYQVESNPVDYMEYMGDPIQVEENKYGWYDEEEGVFFYEDYIVDDDDSFIVHYKDGTSEEIVIYDRLNNFDWTPGIFPVTLADDQYMVPWTMGGENFAFILYLGHELAIPVEILSQGSEPDYPEEPAEPIYAGTPYTVNLVDDMTTYLKFTPDEDGYYLFRSTGDCDTYISVYDDEDWCIGYGDYTTDDDENFFLRLYLQKGITYSLEVAVYNDIPCSFDVYAEPTDIYVVSGSITKRPHKDYVYEGVENESLILDGMEITYNMSDGSTQTVVMDKGLFLLYAYGAPVEYEYDWEINEVYIFCDSIELSYVPEVLENPVDSIEYTGGPLVLSENDGWYDEESGSSYYVFWFGSDDTIRVNYKDGTSEEIIIHNDILNDDKDYYAFYWNDQSEDPWTVGGDNYVYIEYLGYTIQVPVEIVEGSDEPDDPGFDYPTDGTYMIGDANSDEKINVKDATRIQKAIASLVSLDDTQTLAADADGNGTVNIKDATAIQKYVAGIEMEFFGIGNMVDPDAVG